MANRNAKKGGKNIEVFCGSITGVGISSAIAGSIPLIPSNTFWGSRLNAMADTFQNFRFTKLDIKFCPPLAALDTAVGVVTGTVDTDPATPITVSQCEYSAIKFNSQTVPARLVVPRKFLVGQSQLKWFKTQVGTPEAGFEVQGSIYMAMNATSSMNLWVDYEIEFCDWIATTSTPKVDLAAVKRDAIREFLKLANVGDGSTGKCFGTPVEAEASVSPSVGPSKVANKL